MNDILMTAVLLVALVGGLASLTAPDAWHVDGYERDVAAECRDVCARAGLRMVSVRPVVGVQSCECGER